MAHSEDNLLIYGGLAVAAYFIYQRFFAAPATVASAVQGTVSDPVTVAPPVVTNGPGPSGIWLGRDVGRRNRIIPIVPGTDSLSQQIQLPVGVQPPAAPSGYSWQPVSGGNGYTSWRLRQGYMLAVPLPVGTTQTIAPLNPGSTT